MKKKYYWYVAYIFSNGFSDGWGSVYLETNTNVPHFKGMGKYISTKYCNDGKVIIINVIKTTKKQYLEDK